MQISLPFWFSALLLLMLLQQPLLAQDWQLTGNSGTSASTNFLGTTDSKALVLRTNNIQRLRITQSGNVGIGISAPAQKLDVNGNINLAKDSSIYIGNERVLTMETGVFPVIGNLFLGASSGVSNRSGAHNTAAGYRASFANTNGSNNTASGYSALYFNYGSNNTASGSLALYSNLDGYNNSAAGSYALSNNTSGNNNTAAGYYALRYNTNGYNNTASGSYALYHNTGGLVNTASGFEALYNNTTGNSNAAAGYAALYSNTTGNSNTASGNHSLFANNIGNFNTANGYDALNSNTTGSYNTGIGWRALYYNTTGNSNTAVGAYADVSAVNLKNATAIGYGANVDVDNKVRIGNAAVTSIGGQVGWSTFSDGRYKKNIKEDVKGLSFINSLRPITYTVDVNSLNKYFDKGKDGSTYEKMKADTQSSADDASKIVYNGFVAQEVEAAAKKLNYNFSGVDKPKSGDGLYGLRFSDFAVPLVKAVQELSKENNELKSEIQNLKFEMSELKAIVLSNNQSNSTTNYKQPRLNDAVGQETTNLFSATLEQNIPNPFNNSTTIKYNIPYNIRSAQIIITDVKGIALKTFSVNKDAGQITLNNGALAAGIYTYTLFADGKKADSKQMIITK
jgi:hypothetical protein